MKEKQNFLVRHPLIVISFTIICIFLLSANKSWVTHRVVDGEYWVLNYPPDIPFMWQYDFDSNTQLGSTAFFPNYYKIDPVFLDRPMMHGTAWLIGRVIAPIITPVLKLDTLQPVLFKGVAIVKNSSISKHYFGDSIDPEIAIDFLVRYISAAVGLIILKIMVYLIASMMMFQLVRRYSDSSVALFSVVYLLIGGHMVSAIGTYHTYEFSILTPIIVFYLFERLCDKYSATRNIVFSFVIGLLFMVKANYSAYIALIMYSIFFFNNRRLVTGAIAISVLAQSLPWLFWHAYLESFGLGMFGIFSETNLFGKAPPLHPYSIILNDILMSDAERAASQLSPGLPGGVAPSLLQSAGHDYSASGIIALAKLLSSKFLAMLKVYGTPVGFLAAIGAFICWNNVNRRPVIWLLCLLFLTSWIQATVAYSFTWHNRFVYDPYFIVYAVAGWALFKMLSPLEKNTRKFLLTAIVLTNLAITILTHVTLPWVHPYKQTGHYSSNKTAEQLLPNI